MRILVIRTDRMGDVLLSMPVPKALKKASRENTVIMMVAPYTRPIVEKNAYVDEIVEYDPGESIRSLAKRLKNGRYDIAVLLHPTLHLAWALARAGIERRIGTASRVYSFLFTDRVPLRRSVAGLHEAQCNLAMIKDICDAPDDPVAEIFLDEEERAFAKRKLESLDLNSKEFAVIHPGSGGSARDWPIHCFADLAEAVSSETGLKTLVTMGPGEEELVSTMTYLIHGHPTKVMGSLGVRELASVLENAKVVVTNSTGPMHLATAVSTPVVAIFCPIIGCSPSRWGPLGKVNAVLMPEVAPCKRCVGARCVHYDCMETVKVKSVLEAVKRISK